MQERDLEWVPMRRGDVVRARLRRMAAAMLALVVMAAVVTAGYAVYQVAAKVTGLEVRRLEALAANARAKADEAQARVDLVDQRQQTLAMAPGILAATADTVMVAVYAAGDRMLVVILGAALVWSLTGRGRRDG